MEIEITQIGKSLGIILPEDFMEKLGLNKGDKVNVVEQEHGLLVTSLDPDFAQAIQFANEGMRKYKNALTELAK